jgi:hypothetical protein
MKTLDLYAFSVEEMTQREMLEIDGGNIFVDAWNGIKVAAETVAAYAKYYWAKFEQWLAEHQEEEQELVE